MGAFEQVVESIKNNEGFLESYTFDEKHPAAAVLRYVGFLDEQKKLLDVAPTDEMVQDVLLFAIVRNKGFQDTVQQAMSTEGASEIVPHFASLYSIIEEMERRHVRPLLQHYEAWVLRMLGLIEIAAEEQSLRNILLGSQREDLRKEVAAARETILHAQEIRRNYRRTKANKSQLKEQVKTYLNIKTRFGEVATSSLVSKLAVKKNALEDWLQSNPNSTERTTKQDELNQVSTWLIDLVKQKEEGDRGREKDRIALKMGRGAQKIVKSDAKQHRKQFKERVERTRKEVKKTQSSLMGSIEQGRDDLSSIIDQKVEATIALSNLESLIQLIEDKPGGLPDNFRNQKLSELRQAAQARQQEIDDLSRDELRLMGQLEITNEKLSVITRTFDQQLLSETSLEKQVDSLEVEVKRLERLGHLDGAVNIYCSFFHFSYPLLLRIGNLVAGLRGGHEGFDPFKKTSIDTQIHKRLLKMMGLPGGVMKCEAWDVGCLKLSLKVGLSYGVEAPESFTAKVGLALVYEAELSVLDNRYICAKSTIKVVAAGEGSMQLAIPGFTERMTIFKATISAELFRDRTCFYFTDQYHWAAWLCQKWANIVASAIAFDTLYSGNRYSKPTEQEANDMEAAAARVLANDPKIKDVMKDITWFLQEPIMRSDETTLFAGFMAKANVMNDLGGGRLEANRPTTLTLYRQKLDPVSRLPVLDQDSGLPVELKRTITQGSFSAMINLGIIAVEFTYLYGIEAPKSHDIRLVVQLRVSESWSWVRSQVTVVHDFFEGISEQIENSLQPAEDAIADAEEAFYDAFNTAVSSVLGAFGGSGTEIGSSHVEMLTQTLQQWEMIIARITKFIDKKCWFEFGFTRAEIGNGETQWVKLYQRKVVAGRKEGKNERNFAIPIPVVPGLSVDLGIDYSLARATGEKPQAESTAYWKRLYCGLLERRTFTGTHNVSYSTRLPIAFLVGVTTGTFVSGERARKIETFTASSGRPNWASGEGLWKWLIDYDNAPKPTMGGDDEEKKRKSAGDSRRKSLWKLCLTVAAASKYDREISTAPPRTRSNVMIGRGRQTPQNTTTTTSTTTNTNTNTNTNTGGWKRTTPSNNLQQSKVVIGTNRVDLDDEKWVYREIKYDAGRGVGGAAAFLEACKSLLTTLPKQNGVEPGSKEWREWAKDLLVAPKPKFWEKKPSPNQWVSTGSTAAANAYPRLVAAFTAYMEGYRTFTIQNEDNDWAVCAPTETLKSLRDTRSEVVQEHLLDYNAHLDNVESLMMLAGVKRKVAEKALLEKGDYGSALRYLYIKKLVEQAKCDKVEAGKALDKHGGFDEALEALTMSK